MTNKDAEYEKDLNDIKEQILEDGDVLLTKRDLLERFCEINKEYDGSPWNLSQILSNINILIGQEPSEDCVSRQAVSDFLEDHAKDFEDVKVRMAFKAASSLVKNSNNVPSVTSTHKKGKWKEYPHEWGDNWQYPEYECSICHNRAHFDTDYCPNCGAEMESEE